MSKRRSRGLTEDDRAVWDAAARTMRPLRSKPVSFDPPPGEAAPPVRSDANAPPDLPSFRVGERANGHSKPPDLVPNVGQRLAAMPLSMDAKTHGRMKRGKLKPEAKLDLHGMTLAQAHPVLTQFIHRAYGDGLRLVLVVTGKGKDRDSGGPIPVPRGVLRHNVPLWLAAGSLRPLVLQITDAHQRHGGGGAYYVYLRRAR